MKANKPTLGESIGEILTLLLHFDLHALIFAPTENGLLQFLRYCFVGGVATIVDWGVLYIAEKMGLHYLLAAVAGFVFGLACNYALSKFMVFNGETAVVDAKKEFLGYAVIGIIGLGITLVLMFVMTDLLGLYFMISKVIATVLVLIWNFMARKLLLYK